MLAALIICHLCGDFLLQNHWMQRKTQSSFVCAVHVVNYMMPFVVLLLFGLPGWVFIAICIEHFLQDRYALHLKWMKWCQQSQPHQWQAGPLCVDQAMHLTFIGLVFGASLMFGP